MAEQSKSIRELVNHIVDCSENKGKAVEKLKELQEGLVSTIGSFENVSELSGQRFQNYLDLQYLEGYMETPAAQIADIKTAQRKIRDVQTGKRNK